MSKTEKKKKKSGTALVVRYGSMGAKLIIKKFLLIFFFFLLHARNYQYSHDKWSMTSHQSKNFFFTQKHKLQKWMGDDHLDCLN